MSDVREELRTRIREELPPANAVLATFTSPHFTVVMPTLDRVDDLVNAFGRLLPNPYAEGPKEEP